MIEQLYSNSEPISKTYNFFSELEKENKHRRISFARPADDDAHLHDDPELADIAEMSDCSLDESNRSASDGKTSPQLFDVPLNSHKLNEDLFEVNTEIETKEEHINQVTIIQ